MVGSEAYVADGMRLRKVDLGTRAVTTVAGNGTAFCTDAADPLQAGMVPQGMTNDGLYLYFLDTCGGYNRQALRRMSLTTGEVSTISKRTNGTELAIDLTIGPDGLLYVAGGDQVRRVNTSTGAETVVAALPSTFTQLSADAQYLWATTYLPCALTYGSCGGVSRIDVVTGAVTVVYDTQYSDPSKPRVDGPVASAGAYVYVQFLYGTTRRTVAISKATGEYRILGYSSAALSADGVSFDAVMWDLEASGDALYAIVYGQKRLFKISQGPAVGPAGAQAYGSSNPAMNTSCLTCVGDPVDADSGALAESVTDIAVPGRGVALAFTRTFDSRRAGQAGRLGFGWTDSYDWLLTVSSATSGPTKGEVTVRQANGSENVFAPNGTGGYRAPRQVMAALVKNANGTWTYVLRKAVTYSFGATGKLTSISDRNGYTTTLAYDAGGRLSTVTDPAGRALTVTYDASNRVSKVSDPLPRSVSYTYDTAGNLATITDVDTRVTTLGYDSAHRLTTVKDPRTNTVTTAYDATGRATSQTDRRGKVTTFTYGTPPRTAPTPPPSPIRGATLTSTRS
ncbi:MAG: DUF6531 domain-containing protein [Kineosporiaceae bacterium]